MTTSSTKKRLSRLAVPQEECNADAMVQSIATRTEAIKAELYQDHECSHHLLRTSSRLIGESLGIGGSKKLLERMASSEEYAHIPIAISVITDMSSNELRATIDFIEFLLLPEVEASELAAGSVGDA